MYWSVDSIATIAAQSFFVLLAIASVPLRFYAKKRAKTSIGPEDWFAILSMVSSILLYVFGVIAFATGWRDPQLVTGHNLPQWIPPCYVFSSISFYVFLFSVTFARLSFLAFYRRVFTGHKTPRAITLVVVLNYLWAFLWIVSMTLFCIQIQAQWILPPKEKLLIPAFVVLSAVVDLAFDIIIVILPLFFLSKLQMSKSKRRALYFVFGLGILCCVASGARLVCSSVYLHEWAVGNYNTSYTVLVGTNFLWPGIETCIATICISLPSCAVLLPADRRQSSRVPQSGPAQMRTQGLKNSQRMIQNVEVRTPDDELLEETVHEAGEAGDNDV